MYDKDITLALLYLGGGARSAGANVKFFDMGLPENSQEKLDGILEDFQPSAVGINCLFSAVFPSVRILAQRIKNVSPKTKIATGGMHPTMFGTDIMRNCPEIDAICIGEGDLTFPRLLRYWWGELNSDDLDGVIIRVTDKVTEYPKKCYITDLDGLPMPAYDLLQMDNYRTDVKGWYNPDRLKINEVVMPILTSRSCPNACNFCSMRLVMGQKLRMRNPASVFNEIKFLHNTYGINYFKIQDDNFTFNNERALSVCQRIINSGLKVYFDFTNGLMIRTLDSELIKTMRKAGLLRASLAVESGSDYIRNTIMRKNVSKEKISEVFHICGEEGIIRTIVLLTGMPEETRRTMQETLEFVDILSPDFYSHSLLKPYPGTVLFEQCKRDGLFTNEMQNLDNLWTGEFFKTELDTEHQQIFVKPYSMSIDELRTEFLRLDSFLKFKCSTWLNRVKENEKNTISSVYTRERNLLPIL
jgi:magnesium-protoporphyrin IX monomethyl ester (oxidative) cyclase